MSVLVKYVPHSCGMSAANQVLNAHEYAKSSYSSLLLVPSRLQSIRNECGGSTDHFRTKNARNKLECRAVTLPRRETRWNLQGCPKLPNRSQPLVDRSSPYYQDMWRRYCCLRSFFPIVNTCLSSEDIARQSCAMVPKWRFFALCISSEPRAAHFRHAF